MMQSRRQYFAFPSARSARCYSGKVQSVLSSVRSSAYIVVGNGPIGSSVAKHLLEALKDKDSETDMRQKKQQIPLVTLVDGRLSGMKSSHSDRARLIRTFDAEGDVHWTQWNKDSLLEFPKIEKMWNHPLDPAGKHPPRKRFFSNCGGLLVGSREFVEGSLKAADHTRIENKGLQRLSPVECLEKWPYLHPKEAFNEGLWDPSGGIIDPFAFVQAQNACATATSKEGSFETVSNAVIRFNEGGIVELAPGEKLIANEKIILCGGAYSKPLLEASGIKLIDPLKLSASKRTVALLEVSQHTVHGILRTMPTIKYAFGVQESTTKSARDQTQVEAGSVYILPPVRYPERDNKWFVKIGGGPNQFFDDWSAAHLDEWLSSEGDLECAHWLAEILRSLMPDVPFESNLQTMACVTTVQTQSEAGSLDGKGVVVDDSYLADQSLVVVSACQGKGAGPADALGREITKRILYK